MMKKEKVLGDEEMPQQQPSAAAAVVVLPCRPVLLFEDWPCAPPLPLPPSLLLYYDHCRDTPKREKEWRREREEQKRWRGERAEVMMGG